MPRLPDEDPVEFLVRRKFPNSRETYKRATLGTGAAQQSGLARLGQIEAYRQELKKKPRQELSALYEKEQQEYDREREAAQFYNQPDARADFTLWSKKHIGRLMKPLR